MERRDGASPPRGEVVGRGGWGTSEGRSGAGDVLMIGAPDGIVPGAVA